MPIQTLAGNPISSTYQKVVQTDGTYLADGTGSILQTLNITASYASNAFPYTGSAQITGSLGITGYFRITGSSSDALLNIDSPTSSSILFISGSGRVGIGTDNPLATFHIANSSSAAIRLQRMGSSTANINISAGNSRLEFTGDPAGARLTLFQSTKRVGINQQTPTAALHIIGEGTTSATTTLLVQNANTSASLIVQDNGYVGINTGSAAYNLDVNGSVASRGRLTVFGEQEIRQDGITNIITSQLGIFRLKSWANSTLTAEFNGWGQQSYINSALNIGSSSTTMASMLSVYGTRTAATSLAQGVYFNNTLVAAANNDVLVGLDINPTFTTGSFTNVNRLALRTNGNISLSGSTGTTPALHVYKSGSTVMSIQGSQGELFSITDSLSGSLFSVSNISGLPILEVFSDNTVLLGDYLDPMLITTKKVTANSGSTLIYSLPTASYDGAFFDYTIKSGSNARAGQLFGTYVSTTASYTDNSTTDIGDTSGFAFGFFISGSNMVLTGSALTSGWTVRTIIRSI